MLFKGAIICSLISSLCLKHAHLFNSPKEQMDLVSSSFCFVFSLFVLLLLFLFLLVVVFLIKEDQTVQVHLIRSKHRFWTNIDIKDRRPDHILTAL